MIKELLFELHSTLRGIVGEGSIFVLYIAAVIVLISVLAKDRRRFLGVIVSVPAAVAVAVACVFDRVSALSCKNRIAKYAALIFASCLCLLAIASSGKSVFSKELCEKSENDMHLPGDMETVMSAILNEDDHPAILVPYGWSAYFNAYSSRFEVIYDDPATKESDKQILMTELDSIRPDMKKVAGIAHKSGCRYAILPDGIWPQVPIEKCGYEMMLECDGINVYREVTTSP